MGPGEIIAVHDAPHSALVADSVCRAIPSTHLALLGEAFLGAARRSPPILIGTHVRMAEQAERLATQLMICQLPRLADRVLGRPKSPTPKPKSRRAFSLAMMIAPSASSTVWAFAPMSKAASRRFSETLCDAPSVGSIASTRSRGRKPLRTTLWNSRRFRSTGVNRLLWVISLSDLPSTRRPSSFSAK